MKKIKFLLAAFAVFAVAEMSAQTVGDVNAKYNEAVELITGKKYAEAIPVLESVVNMGLDAGPDASATVQAAQKVLPTCSFQYALSLCRDGRFEEALPVLDKTLMYAELYQDVKVLNNARKLTSQTYTALGGDAFNKEDWAKAIEVFSKGFAINPTDGDLALLLAESYAKSGDNENAMKTFQDVANLEQRHSRYQEVAAKAKQNMVFYQTLWASEAAAAGNTDDVYKWVEGALVVAPVDPQANLIRVQTATNAKDWAKVIEWGDAAAEAQTDPEIKSTVYYMLGAAYQNSENKDAAIANFRKVTAGPNVADAKSLIDLLSK